MKKLIGTYEIGHERCQLFVSEGLNGSFTLLPTGHDRLPEIVIGLGEDQWWKTMIILQHEAFEFAMTRSGCRYDPNQDLSNSLSAFLFVMDHAQFSSVCALATDFVSASQAALAHAWKQYRKDRKRTNK